MAVVIDATQKACPIPFMMAKRHIDERGEDFSILVDNRPAVENLKRLARSCGYATETTEEADRFIVRFTCDHEVSQQEKSKETAQPERASDQVLLIAQDTFGSGEKELGTNLLRMFLYTLGQQQPLPKSITMLNSAVHLATEDIQAISSLKALETQGVQIIVCGTCLDYHGLLDRLAVGSVCTMYDIADQVMHAGSVISL